MFPGSDKGGALAYLVVLGEGFESGGVNGARTRNLCRDRAAL